MGMVFRLGQRKSINCGILYLNRIVVMRNAHWSSEQPNKTWILLFLHSHIIPPYHLFSIQIRIRLSMPIGLPKTLLMEYIRSLRCLMVTGRGFNNPWMARTQFITNLAHYSLDTAFLLLVWRIFGSEIRIIACSGTRGTTVFWVCGIHFEFEVGVAVLKAVIIL